MFQVRKLVSIAAILLVSVAAAGCRKKVPTPAPPPAPAAMAEESPAPERPAIKEFVAEPSTIERGQSSKLRWSVSNAEDVSVEPGVGAVDSNGSRDVSPTETTTYTLRASGRGGAVSVTTVLNVTVPPTAEVPKPISRTFAERLESEVRDAYFDFDKFHLREDARVTLTANAQTLKSLLEEVPDAMVAIEGHCDDRGSAEYNLGLGDRRASSALEFLLQLGIPAEKLKTVSYGKERPQCTEQTEDCWQKNRRVHFVAAGDHSLSESTSGGGR